MPATQLQKEELIEVYIATFNRAPDVDGFNYWLSNITDKGWTIQDVAKSMFDSPEVSKYYPSNLSNGDFVDKIYNNVLNRNSDADGKVYWVKQMDNETITKDEMLLAIINGAKADTGSSTDKQTLENKKDVGEYFTITHEFNDINLAKSTMQIVTSEISTVRAAKDMQDIVKLSEDEKNIITQGSNGNDIITTTSDGNFIYSYDGDDMITTLNGNNYVSSGLGVDSVYTGTGDDIIYTSDDNDTVYADAGNDLIYGENGNDSLHGENGDDTIYGGDGNDYLYGDIGNDIIIANDGDDYIYGGSGDDHIYANDGDDFISTGSGENFVDAGAGADHINGGNSIDIIYGGSGNDIIYGDSGSDILDGLTGDDVIYAGSDNDTVNGNDGDDKLYGSDGADKIDGELGNDFISGGLGADTLIGGEGVDTFSIKSNESNLTNMDYIIDFRYSTDRMILENKGNEVIYANKADISSANDLTSAVNLVASGDGSTNAIVKWFVYGDYTYIVEDINLDATFNNDTDIVVKLQGVLDLEGLNNSTLSFEN